MVDTSIEILTIMKHYFKLDLKAVEAARRIQQVEENETLCDYTAQNWFEPVKGGDLYLEIKPRSGQSSVVDYDARREPNFNFKKHVGAFERFPMNSKLITK